MLVLGRYLGEAVVIDGGITLYVVEIQRNRVRLTFEAPPETKILRGELAEPPVPKLKEKKR